MNELKNHERIQQAIRECYENRSPSLDLSNCGLTELPEDIRNLRWLRELKIPDNRISELPEWLIQLRDLHELEWYDNGPIQLPSWLPRLKNLERLWLLGPDVRNLAALDKVTSLTNLGLATMGFRGVPDFISHLPKLHTLYLFGNELSSLPGFFRNLRNLRHLGLNSNRFSTFPPELFDLQSLQHLDLSGNPLMEGRPELAHSGDAQELIQLFRRTSGPAGKQALREVKVLVVGQGEVGKTSMIRALMGEAHDSKETKTEGIVRRKLAFNCPSKGEVRLNIWDFGGQEIMHSTHQFFLTARSVYLLVLDSRQDERASRVEYWLRLIKTFGGGSPVIVVCNKSDEQPMKLAWETLQDKFPQVKYYVREVSCQGNEGKGIESARGIDELKQRIKDVIEEHVAHIDRPFRMEWFALKDALENDCREYLTLHDYEDLCRQHHIDKDDWPLLLNYFNDLGIMLYFGDHPIMRDKHVLQPDWVTGAIYRALNDHELNRKHGVLSRDDLRRILADVPGHSYPHQHEEFIIEMMLKFGMCFRLENSNSVLMPDLLQKDKYLGGYMEPKLSFRYKYPVLPGSVMSRFIVRMHLHIPDSAYWLTGAVVKRGSNHAVVVADLEDCFVDIKITGPAETALLLMDIIRAEFEAIHGTFSEGLGVEELVPVPGFESELLDYRTLVQAAADGKDSFYTKSRKDVPLLELIGPIYTKRDSQSGIGYQYSTKTRMPEIISSPIVVRNDDWWKTALISVGISGIVAAALMTIDAPSIRVVIAVMAAVGVFMFNRNPLYVYRRTAAIALASVFGLNALSVSIEANWLGSGIATGLKFNSTASAIVSACGLILAAWLYFLDYRQHYKRRD